MALQYGNDYLLNVKELFTIKKKNILSLLLFAICFISNLSAQYSLLEEYDILVEDLSNIRTFGYRGIVPGSSSRVLYPYISGDQIIAGYDDSYAIQGEGFFRVYDEKNKKYYCTRFGMFIKVGNEYYTDDGYRYLLIGQIKPVLEEGKKEEKVSISTSTCDLVYPVDERRFIRQGKYFVFPEVKVLKDQILINGRIELPNVNVSHTLTRMIFILKNIKATGKKNDVAEIDTKIFILENLWKMTLIKEANWKFENDTYWFHDLSFPNESYRKIPGLFDLDWQRRTSYYSRIIMMVPFLKRDYR